VAKEAKNMIVDCANCKQAIRLETEEITCDWQYQTTCPYCGQEQAGALYFGTESSPDETASLLHVVLK